MDFDALLSAHEASSEPKFRETKRKRDEGGGGQQRVSFSRNRKRSRAVKPQFAWDKLEEESWSNLVIVCAGDESLHVDWVAERSKREFDLCVVYYGSNEEKKSQFEKDCEIFFAKKGPKWQLVRHALTMIKDWRAKYLYVWMTDDDLKTSCANVNLMFTVAKKHKLMMGQPALFDENVHPKYRGILLHRPGREIHFTNFVEIMCPFLRVDALDFVFHTIDMDQTKSGWGLDVLWPTLIKFYRIGVIDATPLRHTRPAGAFKEGSNTFYAKFQIDPAREFFDLQMKYRFREFRLESYEEVFMAG